MKRLNSAAIWSVTHLFLSTCNIVHCLGEKTPFSSTYTFPFFRLLMKKFQLERYNLTVAFWRLWVRLAGCCLVRWLLIWLLSVVIDPSCVHCYRQVRSIWLKLLQTAHRIIDTLLFLIHYNVFKVSSTFWYFTWRFA